MCHLDIMSVSQVLSHVPGDREAVIDFLNKKRIEYVSKGSQIIIKNTYIHLDNYGGYGSRLGLYSDSAKDNEGKPVVIGGIRYGICIPLRDQISLFNSLKREIMKHRDIYFKEMESIRVDDIRCNHNSNLNFI